MAKLKNQLAEIYQLWKQGYNNIEIAKMYNVSRSLVGKTLSQYKDYIALNGNPEKKVKDKYKAICTLYIAGSTLTELSKKFDYSIQGINKILIKNNVKKRKQGVHNKKQDEDNYRD